MERQKLLERFACKGILGVRDEMGVVFRRDFVMKRRVAFEIERAQCIQDSGAAPGWGIDRRMFLQSVGGGNVGIHEMGLKLCRKSTLPNSIFYRNGSGIQLHKYL